MFKYSYIFMLISSSCVHASTFIENTDITDQINEKIKNGGTLSIPAGNYKIDALKSIQVRNNTTINLSSNTVLNVIPNDQGSYRVFNINNIKNVKISGGTLIGDKYTHLSKDGEWGMGIEIKDSQNISISNVKINKMWGDAIYIGTNGADSNYNIHLNNIKMDDNRRQGISIISVKKLRGYNLYANNTSGTNPASGIDIEPNNNKAVLQDIYLRNIYTSGNQGSGLHSYFGFYKGSKKPIDITIQNHVDSNSKYGFYMLGLDNNAIGNFKINNANYQKSKTSNLCLSDWKNPNFALSFDKYKSDNMLSTNNDCKVFKNNNKIIIN
ncbi:right-handed parallel beta-helix repeat-containing protein [Acinetobacter sp. Marseille-Q1623]|uniref:right-handed parallel beta-helix repeat-containing protein n=1 Tax=Acinetobacter sp. Marseille-Q1623 TaxID=2697501 RepID=UPI00157A377C|nr:right-handed parallel beta-helix repeat-containing protein [Acinetobacter sp. Marseille-Q1623]